MLFLRNILIENDGEWQETGKGVRWIKARIFFFWLTPECARQSSTKLYVIELLIGQLVGKSVTGLRHLPDDLDIPF